VSMRFALYKLNIILFNATTRTFNRTGCIGRLACRSCGFRQYRKELDRRESVRYFDLLEISLKGFCLCHHFWRCLDSLTFTFCNFVPSIIVSVIGKKSRSDSQFQRNAISLSCPLCKLHDVCIEILLTTNRNPIDRVATAPSGNLFIDVYDV
jgi:hypothetical protein